MATGNETIEVKKGGTWQEPHVYTKTGGVWKPAYEVYVKDAGLWVPLYSKPVIAPRYTVPSQSRAGAACYVGLYWDGDGSLKYRAGDTTITATGENWLISGTASNYYVKLTVVSGPSPIGSAVANVVYQLNGDRDFYTWDTTADGNPITAEWKFELFDDAAGGAADLVDSHTYTLVAERTS